jgi:hypothetical protein
LIIGVEPIRVVVLTWYVPISSNLLIDNARPLRAV